MFGSGLSLGLCMIMFGSGSSLGMCMIMFGSGLKFIIDREAIVTRSCVEYKNSWIDLSSPPRHVREHIPTKCAGIGPLRLMYFGP